MVSTYRLISKSSIITIIIIVTTYLPYYEPSKKDEQDMLSTADELRRNLSAMFSYRLLHMDSYMVLAVQQGLIYISSVLILDPIKRTGQIDR